MGKKGNETTLVGTRLPNDIIDYIQEKVAAREYSSLSHGVIRLITLGIKYEKEKDNRLLKKLFKRAPIGICVTDTMGSILIWNNHMIELAGYPEDELGTMNIGDIYSFQEEPLNLSKLLEGKDHIKDYFVELKKRDGDSVGLLLSVEIFSVKDENRFLTVANSIK